MASRILGMGDVLTLIERAQEQIDEGDALELERKLKTSEFGLDDLLDQLRRIRKMGSLRSLLGMIPGIGKQVKDMQVDDKQLDRVEAMILSMTPSERRNPSVIDGSRRRRIASGSGTSVQQVNQLLQQHRQMKKMMKQVAAGGTPAMGGCRRRNDRGLPARGAIVRSEGGDISMAVKIRLTRLGSKKNAHYRVVVIDSHSPRDGKSIETIGRYVPQADPSVVEIDADRARAWLAKGAQPSEPVKKLLKIAGV